MSRKQFLAELSQYLTFVSPEQRDEIISYYDAMLENAGLKGEAALLQEIGTPMTVAITIKRRLEANEPLLPKISDKIDTPYFVKFRRCEVKKVNDSNKVEGQKETLGSTRTEKVLKPKIVSEAKETIDPEAAPEKAAETQTAETTPETEQATESKAEETAHETEQVSESETEETTPETEQAAESETAETAPETEQAAESETAETAPETEQVAESKTEETAPETEQVAESKTEETAPETEQAAEPKDNPFAATTINIPIDTVETPVKPPMTFGRVITAIGIAIASIVIVAFFICITAIGGIIISSAVDIIISGFDSISYLSDQLMIFAGGALVMAFGILLAWFSIWAAISLIIGMIRSFNRTVAPEKNVLKSFWKVVWIILLVLVSITIICGGVSLCLGGDTEIFGKNEAFSQMLSKLSPTAFMNFFKNSGLLG